jgi:Uma2 family endonuclease
MSAVATSPAKKLMTADEFYEFCNLPRNENKSFELVRGEVIEMPGPSVYHGVVIMNVGIELKMYARRVKQGYVAGNDAGVRLEEEPDTIRGPDVAYYTETSDEAQIPRKWAVIPPVLAVEVSSPSDRPGRINAKVRDYLSNGVKLVWLIDTEDRKVSIYRPNRTLEVIDETAELTGGEELPGFSCPVRNLFSSDGQIGATSPKTP